MTTTTRDLIGQDNRAFHATWQRILAKADAMGANKAKRTRTEPVVRNYSVQCVTSQEIVEQAKRWRSQYKAPEHVERDPQTWASDMARIINGPSGYLVRRYWRAVIDEVFVTARFWPVLSDLHAAALAVAKREGGA